jgi:hypothetical protein
MPIDASTAGVLLGLLLIGLLVYWTCRRLLFGDRNDPSMFIGGDWLLVRASGVPLVAILVAVTAVVLWPYLGVTSAGVLIALLAYWLVSQLEETKG